MQLLLGAHPCIESLGSVILHRLNQLYLHRLEKDNSRQPGVNVIALDEAGAIEELIAQSATAGVGVGEDLEMTTSVASLQQRAAAIDGSGTSLGAAGGRERTAAHEILRRAPHDLWRDMMHPSQRMHAALAFSMIERFREQSAHVLERSSSRQPVTRKGYAPPRGAGGSDSGPEGGVTVPLC